MIASKPTSFFLLDPRPYSSCSARYDESSPSPHTSGVVLKYLSRRASGGSNSIICAEGLIFSSGSWIVISHSRGLDGHSSFQVELELSAWISCRGRRRSGSNDRQLRILASPLIHLSSAPCSQPLLTHCSTIPTTTITSSTLRPSTSPSSLLIPVLGQYIRVDMFHDRVCSRQLLVRDDLPVNPNC
jgi:hypothetical protein